MSRLIVCLGYDLLADGSIPSLLENRLIDSAKLCNENPGATLLLMGNVSYRDAGLGLPTQAQAMRRYLEENFSADLREVDILMEEKTTSSVAQIAYLRELVDASRFAISEDGPVVIVSSEFICERIQLYVDYIFGTTEGFKFIDSKVPDDLRNSLQIAESIKLPQTRMWLNRHAKGDYRSMLKDQAEFEKKILDDEVDYPRT